MSLISHLISHVVFLCRYANWMTNSKKQELKKYAELDLPEFHINSKGSLSRLWELFLAWSVVAAGQGSATCYQASW